MKNTVRLTAGEQEWKDWKWHQRNSLSSSRQIKRYFPNFPDEEIETIAKYEKEIRWGITPYTLSLMGLDDQGNPSSSDPIVRQTFPIRGFSIDTALDSHDRENINWELPEEMPTPILQHKYTKKALFRIPNSCLGYCGFCFEVGRVGDKQSKKESVNDLLWEKSIEYIEQHPEIVEVILSGGEPLLLDNEKLESKLADVRAIPHIRSVRIHTRALTFNPYRFDDGLVDMLKRHRVTELGVHMCHPNELTDSVKEALDKFEEIGYGGILKMGQIPLLKGINNDPDVLEELFMRMYADFGIKPYYLIHSIPWSPGANQFRTSVKEGVRLMNSMKRHIPNVAMPEYIIVHHKGKHTVPLEENGTPEFQYGSNDAGHPVIKFKNWKGKWETYLDGRS